MVLTSTWLVITIYIHCVYIPQLESYNIMLEKLCVCVCVYVLCVSARVWNVCIQVNTTLCLDNNLDNKIVTILDLDHEVEQHQT